MQTQSFIFLIPGEVATTILGPTTGPQDKLFINLAKNYEEVRFQKIEPLPKDILDQIPASLLQSTIALLKKLRSNGKFRNDYREALLLALMVLGEIEEPLLACQGIGQARWLCKVIYIFKLYLLRFVLGLDSETILKLEQLALFYAVTYVKYWLTCTNLFDLPITTLEYYKELHLWKVCIFFTKLKAFYFIVYDIHENLPG